MVQVVAGWRRELSVSLCAVDADAAARARDLARSFGFE